MNRPRRRATVKAKAAALEPVPAIVDTPIVLLKRTLASGAEVRVAIRKITGIWHAGIIWSRPPTTADAQEFVDHLGWRVPTSVALFFEQLPAEAFKQFCSDCETMLVTLMELGVPAEATR